MCFETIKVHSCFECVYEAGSSLLKTQATRQDVQKPEIMETAVARSLPVMRQRPGNTLQVRRDWRISVTLLVAMAAYIAVLKFYSTETAMVSKDKMNIGSYLIIGFMCIVGAGSTLCIVVSMFAILAKKIYRKIRYGASLYD